MSIKVITLKENGEDVEYVLYVSVNNYEGKKYSLLLLKAFMEVHLDDIIDREQIVRALFLFEVKNDSYLRVEDEALKKKVFENAIRRKRDSRL